MNRSLYSILIYLLSPFILGYLLFRAIKAPEYRHGLWQRLGLVSFKVKENSLVIHCASVGEVRAAVPLINSLIEHYPELSIIVTTTTPTGKAAVLSSFASRVQHCYLPIDWPGSCKRFIRKVKPQIVILMETEIWPNLLKYCAKNNVPVLLANARLSEKSLKKYLKYPQFSLDIFSHISKIAAQYESDKDNFVKLGLSPEKIILTGSIKFDIEVSESIKIQQNKMRETWLLKSDGNKRPVWLAGSIHPAEFEDILQTHQLLLNFFPDLLLIAVPRHPEKFDELKKLSENFKLSFISRTDDLVPGENIQVVVGDTMGEMLLFFALADIAYIGGSLIERGGHNPLEAIACGTPVIMGPHYYNFSDVCDILLKQRVLKIVDTPEDLALTMKQLLSNKAELSLLSNNTRQIMIQNKGSLDKIIQQTKRLTSM